MPSQRSYFDLENIEFSDNPSPRCPCVLLLDTSASMSGEPIRQLNAGSGQFFEELTRDEVAARRVEVSVITFGGTVNVEGDFGLVHSYAQPAYPADGMTPMGEAIQVALDRLRDRKETYKRNGISYYRPWLFIITDGAPTDSWTGAAAALRDAAKRGEVTVFGVGVQGANMTTLAQICPTERPPLLLEGLKFREFFLWLSASLKSLSRSQPGTDLQLANPFQGPHAWATVTT